MTSLARPLPWVQTQCFHVAWWPPVATRRSQPCRSERCFWVKLGMGAKTQDPIMLVAWTCMNYCIKTWCSIFLFTFFGWYLQVSDPWHLGCTEHSAPIILQIWWFRFNPSLNHNLIIIFKYKLVVWCILRFLRYPLFSDTHRSICLALRRKKNRSNVRCLSRWTMSASASAWWTCPLVRLGWKLVSGPQICIPGIVQEWLVTGW